MQVPTITNIACVGAGYVGGSTMAVIAEKCPEITVTVIDIDQKKIDAWNSNNLPIYEPGLQEIVEKQRGKNLFYTTNTQEAISKADLIFIAIGTPTKGHGTGAGKAAMLGFFESATRMIAPFLRDNVVIVEKSTVPVGVAQSIRTVLSCNTGSNHHFSIVSNPEFLAEGTAIDDLHEPSRILIGNDDTPEGVASGQALASVYAHWVPKEKILMTNVWSSELSKLTANALLAQRISSINSIAAICEKTGANVNEVSRAIGADTRIGSRFLQASVGFGGSCFQKDIFNLVYIAESLGLMEVATYFNQIIIMNDWTRHRFARDIVHSMFDTLFDKKITVLGFAFKANTGDTRESSAITVINYLLSEGAIVNVYDPKVTKEQMYYDLENYSNPSPKDVVESRVNVFNCPYEASVDAHAIVLLTEWPSFKELDYDKIYKSMKKPAFFFDGRNLINRDMLRKIGFCTHGIGVAPDQLAS
ncbi:UDP-glucose 6-dehydrogenase [Tritrichomonas foetus]|uniref:UDP-glucose 6-dehydrogenase n=1 Tax=Tritrichomonas foetus TaxID=1144522 RepID=A0A1J4KB55_9EUKA|nr:UDP-glucose 6-dehydrogenase [Tritrichomonas foetus]|eukprot:OHT06926.1 UDP-glucose 6-dehydrogenase [Tritrichomonas foetus]